MPGLKTVLGIDITEERINMVLLKKHGDKFRLLKVAEGPIPEGVVRNGNVENPDALAIAARYWVSTLSNAAPWPFWAP